jgi:IclR family transcriptional regulator, KDG regulon repressor
VFHLLSTLQARQLVTQDPETCRYQLNWGLYTLGASMTRTHSVVRAVRGRLGALAQATGETVLVGIQDEGTVLYIDRAESPSGLAMVANIGRRAPLHAVATGKVLLAHAPVAEVERVLASTLPAFTPTTVTDTEELRRQLETARRQGYARCWQEHEAGVSSISVPVRDYTGEVVAALTIAGPSTRLTARAVRRQLVPLRQAATALESRLGAAGAVQPDNLPGAEERTP